MTTLLLIAASIALIAMAAAILYSILLMKDARKVLNRLEGSVRDASESVIPLLDNSSAITGKIRQLTESAGGELTKLKSVGDSLAKAVGDAADFVRRIKTTAEEPLTEAVGYLAAFSKGIKTFLQFLEK